MSIYSPISASDTYCIYDQFHFGNKDHLEIPVKGHDAALERYQFYKTLYPGYCLGLCTIEYFNHKKGRMKQ